MPAPGATGIDWPVSASPREKLRRMLSLRPDLRVALLPDGAVRLKQDGETLMDIAEDPLRGIILALLEGATTHSEITRSLIDMGIVVDTDFPSPRTPQFPYSLSDGGRPRIGPISPCPRCFPARRASHHPPADDGDLVPALCEARVLAAAANVSPGEWIGLDACGENPRVHYYSGLPDCDRCPMRAEALVDPASGIFESVEIRRETNFYHAVAQACDVSVFAPNWNVRVSGGVAATEEDARWKALGEGLERYCAALAVLRASPPTAWRKLTRPALRPAEIPLFSVAQYRSEHFPYAPFTDDTPVRWITARAIDGAEILVPLALVALPYEPAAPEPCIAPYLSHGLACGRSVEEATTAALCELVERHAFTVFWMRGEPARRVSWTAHVTDLAREISDRNWQVTVYDLRREISLPTFLAVGRAEFPMFWIGAGAAEDPVDALRRALLELLQNHAWLVSATALHTDAPQDFEAHGMWYARDPARVARLSFLDGGPEIDLPTRTPWRESLMHFVCDLTTPDVAAAGCHVVRVLAPPLVRLHVDHPFRGHPMLASADNPLPHPFP